MSNEINDFIFMALISMKKLYEILKKTWILSKYKIQISKYSLGIILSIYYFL